MYQKRSFLRHASDTCSGHPLPRIVQRLRSWNLVPVKTWGHPLGSLDIIGLLLIVLGAILGVIGIINALTEGCRKP
jgi:hypothetical protein